MPVRFQATPTEKNSEGMKIFQFHGVKNSLVTDGKILSRIGAKDGQDKGSVKLIQKFKLAPTPGDQENCLLNKA